jgi:hypothetical protein
MLPAGPTKGGFDSGRWLQKGRVGSKEHEEAYDASDQTKTSVGIGCGSDNRRFLDKGFCEREIRARHG